ncbi:MAG: hypothetical protein MUD03_17245 [Pirellula sp.]|jgi:hypothetical protein|nr:hypothetical protein [Pirellula sp.]
MANNLGLFQWIREGVRQSVLLGVTDALESIGSPDDASKLHPALMSLSSTPAGNLQAAESGEVVARRPGAAPRKRLGRSLKELEPNKPAS